MEKELENLTGTIEDITYLTRKTVTPLWLFLMIMSL